MEQDELPLLQHYRAWIQSGADLPDEERERFFAEGLVVLDTNVLLSLYEYTPSARDQVFTALARVQERLWLPHQVGLEFVRRRHAVIEARTKALRNAKGDVDRRLQEARNVVLKTASVVQNLFLRYAADRDEATEIDDQINEETVDNLLLDVREELKSRVQKLRHAHGLTIVEPVDDPVLPRVAALYGERIGPHPLPEVLRYRIDEAIGFRFPNRIPPGFADAGKGTPLEQAGDYLLWAEILDKAKQEGSPNRVLFISADMKEDWYEHDEQGRAVRPLPMLADELRLCSGAELRIETPRQFFDGITEFLDGQIAAKTYDEIDRAAETLEKEQFKQDAVQVVEDLRARLTDGDSSDEVLDAYLRAKSVLAESMQALARRELSKGSPAFHELRGKLAEETAEQFGRSIPERYLRIPYGSQVHEDLFMTLLNQLGEPVPAARLRVITGDSVHTERRVRELRELGFDIQASKEGYTDVYTLQSLDLDTSAIRIVIKNNLRQALNSGHLHHAEYQELLGKLGL